MKARVVYWGTTSALYTGSGSFSVYLLDCNKKFQVRIETGGKPIWSVYFSTLGEATEWAYENAKPKGEPTVTTEELIAKYPEQLREFSEFLRLKKKGELEEVLSNNSVQILHVVTMVGKGRVYKIPGTDQTRTMYRWSIDRSGGTRYASSRDTDNRETAERQLKEVLEALG